MLPRKLFLIIQSFNIPLACRAIKKGSESEDVFQSFDALSYPGSEAWSEFILEGREIEWWVSHGSESWDILHLSFHRERRRGQQESIGGKTEIAPERAKINQYYLLTACSFHPDSILWICGVLPLGWLLSEWSSILSMLNSLLWPVTVHINGWHICDC